MDGEMDEITTGMVRDAERCLILVSFPIDTDKIHIR